MGWKNVKEHYRIGHIVQVTDAGICIGSPYIHDIIVIGMDGTVQKRYDKDGWTTNKDLRRYMAEFDADPEKLREVVQSPDTFTADVTVYTYDGGKIIEKHCEAAGWPNLCHDGQIQYDNTFSTDKTKVVKWAKENAAIGLRWMRESVQEAREKLTERIAMMEKTEREVAELEEAYPGVEYERQEEEEEGEEEG